MKIVTHYHLDLDAATSVALHKVKKNISDFSERSVEFLPANTQQIPDDLKNDLLAKHSLSVYNLLLPQINAIFFNTTDSKFLADIKLRQALAYAIDYDFLITNILNGEVKRANGPILAADFIYNPCELQYNFDRVKAGQLLTENHYELVEINDQILAGTEFTDQEMAVIDYASSTQMEIKGLWRVIKDNKIY